MAYDGGSRSSTGNTVRISFVNKTGEPYFISNSWTTDFTENDEGKDELRLIPVAIDPKDVDVVNEEEKFKIYYFIDGALTKNHFKL